MKVPGHVIDAAFSLTSENGFVAGRYKAHARAYGAVRWSREGGFLTLTFDPPVKLDPVNPLADFFGDGWLLRLRFMEGESKGSAFVEERISAGLLSRTVTKEHEFEVER